MNQEKKNFWTIRCTGECKLLTTRLMKTWRGRGGTVSLTLYLGTRWR